MRGGKVVTDRASGPPVKRLPSGVLWGSAWKPRTTAALWLNRARQVVSWTMLSACLAWDLAYLVGGLPGNAAVTRAACQTRAYLPLFHIIVSGRLRQEVAYRCLLGGGEPALSAIAFVTKLSVAVASGVTSLILLVGLLALQPPRSEDMSRVMRPPATSRKIRILYGRYFLLPAVPIVLTGYLLDGGSPNQYGNLSNLAYTSIAFVVHMTIANLATPVVAIRLDPARLPFDIPPTT